MEHVIKRMRKRMSKPTNKLDVEFITPKITTLEAQIQLQRTIEEFGQDILRNIQTLAYIRREIELGHHKKPHVYWQLAKQLIKVLASLDPFQPHYELARAILTEIAPEFLDNSQIVALLATELNNQFKRLNVILAPPKDFKELLEAAKSDSDQLAIENGYPLEIDLGILECDESNDKFEAIFKKHGMFIWDYSFLSLLKNIGIPGEEAAKALEPELKKQLKDFDATEDNPLKYWLNLESKEANIYISKHFITLGIVIYDSKIKKTLKIRENYVAANKAPDHDFLSKLLSPKTSIEQNESSLKIFNEGKQVSYFPIAAMSEDVAKIVIKGAMLFNKANAFRIVRNFSKRPFQKFANGDPDFRVLRYSSGATDIAEESGIPNGKKYITEVNQIVHAMAYGCFCNGISEGNLIQYSKDIPSKVNQNPGCTIIVGTMLVPYGELIDDLLIPLFTEPSLVSPTQYYAGQYYLHMQISREFSVQSVQFAQYGAIQITQNQLEEMARRSGLPLQILKKVMDRWTSDGDNMPKMLDKIEDNFYTLGPSLNNEAEFLRRQGLLRLENSRRGTLAAQRRAFAKNR